MAPEHAMLLQGTPLLHRMHYCREYHRVCSRCSRCPSGYHTNTGYMAYLLSHIMAPLQGMHSTLHPGYSSSIGCYSMPHLLQGIICQQPMQSTAADTTTLIQGIWPLNYLTYHTIMAPEHAMLLQGTPRCSRVLHCSIGCYSTAAEYHIYCRGCNLLQPMQSTAADARKLPQRIPH